ncbi:MAG: 2-phosphosulfolactate phosphatase [Gemmatimonadaceae bacterium]|nr:2-phosphosulfolactate phosphatase [Gemmatimonadaceae bacterium]
MRIDVAFHGSAAGQGELHDRVVLVIDVLRASTSIAAALANGARAVIPVAGVDEAITRARSLDRSEVLTAGERRMRGASRSAPRRGVSESASMRRISFCSSRTLPGQR